MQRDRELVRVMQENKDLLFKSNKSDATNRELLETCRYESCTVHIYLLQRPFKS